MEITATIDGKVKVVSEASIRRHLKLEDSNGISNLPTIEIFEQLALMGYVSNSDKLTFQKGHFSPQWRFLIHSILHCLSSKKTAWEQFSSNIATAIICLATNRTFNFSKLIFDGMVKNLDSQILQGEGSTIPVESHHTPTVAPSTSQPHHSPTLRDFIRQETKGRHDHEMEDDFEFITGEDVTTANVSVNTAGAEISIASPKVKTVGVSVDDVVAEGLVYIRRSATKRKDKEERQRIASIHEEASTFKPEEWDNIQAQIEADEELAHRLQAQERERYSEADKAKLLLELINERKTQFAQQRAQQRRNRPLTRAQQRSYKCNYIKRMGSHTLQQLRGCSFDEIKFLFEATMKRVNTFTLMESDDTVPKVVAGSSKRSIEEELGEESSKIQKIREGSEPAEESKDKESNELSQEQLQQLMIIVLEEGTNVEALQTKYPIIDWENFDRDDLVKLWDLVRERFSSTEPTDDKERALWVELKRLFEPDTDDLLELQRYMHDPLTWRLYDTCGVHHVSTETGLDIFMLVEKDYPMTRGLPMLMLVNKLQVDQHSEMANELLRKIFILANRPRH
ncbi:hypothetical protein Tco_1087101 [Tanacetum coccineum]